MDHPDAPRSARWATLERLYHEALTLDVGSRKAFLIAGCAGDAALLAEVESLLAHDGGAAFLDSRADGRPAVGSVARDGHRVL